MSQLKSSILITDFPVELIHMVTDGCETKQLLSLCRVSKHINAVVSRILYRKITLSSTRAAVRCFQTMLARPDFTKLTVRVLKLDADTDDIPSYNFYTLAVAAIARACYLTELHISKAQPLVNLLRDIPLTHLSHCVIAYDTTIGKFLRNHLNLGIVLIVRKSGETHSPVEPFPSVHFPELVCFIGPADIGPYILANSRLQQLVLYWDTEHTFQSILTTCPSFSSFDTLNVLEHFMAGWICEIVTTSASYFPNLITLEVKNFNLKEQSSGIEEFFLAVENSMSSFTHLQTFSASYATSTRSHGELDQEYQMVIRWGKIRPTLCSCTLTSGIRWYRLVNNGWIPETRVEDRYLKIVINNWVHKAILTAKFPTEVDTELRRLLPALGETEDESDDGSDTGEDEESGYDEDSVSEEEEEEYSDEEGSNGEYVEEIEDVVLAD